MVVIPGSIGHMCARTHHSQIHYGILRMKPPQSRSGQYENRTPSRLRAEGRPSWTVSLDCESAAPLVEGESQQWIS